MIFDEKLIISQNLTEIAKLNKDLVLGDNAPPLWSKTILSCYLIAEPFLKYNFFQGFTSSPLPFIMQHRFLLCTVEQYQLGRCNPKNSSKHATSLSFQLLSLK